MATTDTKPDHHIIEPETLVWLEPASIAMRWDGATGPIHLTLANDRTILNVVAAHAFPRSGPDVFIQFFELNTDGKRGPGVGILKSLDEVPVEYRPAIEECLRRHYIVPTVTRIIAAARNRHIVHWTIETDRGPCEFDIENVYKNIESMPDGRIIMSDTSKNRYEIPVLEDLDPVSRRLVGRYV